jgi:uncharacterized protein (TIGR00255 family)
VKKLLPKALDELVASREREGEKISDTLKGHLENIEGRLGKVQSRVPLVVDVVPEAARRPHPAAAHPARAWKPRRWTSSRKWRCTADRCDTSEEIQRLRSHIGEFRKIIAQKGQLGPPAWTS